jgi:hypothetical protein
MSDETSTFALKHTLNEIRNAYPNIKNAFIFKNSKTITADENTDTAPMRNAVRALNAITKHANTIGGIETVTIHSTNGKANITHIHTFYLTTITSKETDEKNLNTLTQTLLPIVLKLIVKIHPASLSEYIFTLEEPEPAELPIEENTETEPEPDAPLPKPPVSQFIIENLTGILAPQDTVRIDKAEIEQWKNLYPNKTIKEVDAEALNGKTTRCKIQPIKDSKQEGKGIIQIPEKIQVILQTKKGELVMIKPVIE